MKVISPKALSHLSLPCILKYFLEWRGRRAWRRCSRNSSYLTAFFVSHSRIRVCLWEPTAYVSLVSHAHQNLCIHQCLAQRPAGKNCKSHWLNLPRCSYLKHKIKRGPRKKHAILFYFIVLYVLVAQSCLTLCDPMDCSPPGSPVHGIFQVRILEWVAISFSRGSFRPRYWTQVSCIAGKCFTIWATREALLCYWAFRNSASSWLQIILQSYSHQDSMVLAQK